MALLIKEFIALIEKSSNESKADTHRGPIVKDEHRTIYGMFYPTERYIIDCAQDRNTDEWKQFDTWQDAPYFGVWTSRKLLCTLTYAEGDWSLVKCNNEAAFDMELNEIVDFYITNA